MLIGEPRSCLRRIGLLEWNSDAPPRPFDNVVSSIVVQVPAFIVPTFGKRDVQPEFPFDGLLRGEFDRHALALWCQSAEHEGRQRAICELVSDRAQKIETGHPATRRTQSGQTFAPMQYAVMIPRGAPSFSLVLFMTTFTSIVYLSRAPSGLGRARR